MTPRMMLGLAVGAGAALGVGLVFAATSSPAPSKAPGGAPWRVTQGHRYQVTLSAPAGNVDFSKMNGTLPATLFTLVPGAVTSTQTSLLYQLDAIGPTHDEPAVTFMLGLDRAGPTLYPQVTLNDMGLSPSSTSPDRSTRPQGQPGPFSGYGSPYHPPAPPTTPTVAGAPTLWLPAISVPYLWRVRWTMTAAQVSSAINGAAPSRDALTSALASVQVQGHVQSDVFLCWGPGDVLPNDWPPDDAHLADGYHVELVYGVLYVPVMVGSFASTFPNGPPQLLPSDLATLGIEVTGFWSTTGTPGPATISGPSLTWTRATQIQPGDHVRTSFSAADAATLVAVFLARYPQIQNLGYDPTCVAILANAADTFGRLLAPQMLVWCPTAPLAPDWPADDTAAASEFHLEFRYAGPPTSVFGVPMTVWVGT